MAESPERVLTTLRDVAGVEGSWVTDGNGVLLARDLGALYPDDLLGALAARFRQMSAAAAEHLPGRDDDLCLRFEARELFVRRAGPLLLVVMTLPAVNYQSLRIGVHLVLRQFSAAPAAAPPPAPLAAPAAARVISPPRPASNPPPPPRRPPPPPKRSSGIWGD